jgi:hypothetical protein
MKLQSVAALAIAAMLVALPIAGRTADTAKAMTGHPQSMHAPVTVVHPAKPLPMAKHEAERNERREHAYWVPGDYYWDGDDWRFADGYWMDEPFDGAIWIPGHWANRWWGETWIPGHWM